MHNSLTHKRDLKTVQNYKGKKVEKLMKTLGEMINSDSCHCMHKVYLLWSQVWST